MSGTQTAPADQVTVGESPLSIEDVVAVARYGATVRIADTARAAMRAARVVVDEHAGSDRAIYGVSTGFGALASRKIDVEVSRPPSARSHSLPRRGFRR